MSPVVQLSKPVRHRPNSEGNWSQDVRDTALVSTPHVFLVEHLGRAGDKGSHRGYAYDQGSMTLVLQGAVRETITPIDPESAEPIGDPVVEIMRPGHDDYTDDMERVEAAHGVENVRWDYLVMATPSLWWCIYVKRKTGIRLPEYRTVADRRKELLLAGSVFRFEPDDERLALLLSIDLQFSDKAAPFHGSILFDEKAKFTVLSGTGLVIYPVRDEL